MADDAVPPFLLYYTTTFCILVALAMSETATTLFRKLVPGLAQPKATADAPVPPSEHVATAELQPQSKEGSTATGSRLRGGNGQKPSAQTLMSDADAAGGGARLAFIQGAVGSVMGAVSAADSAIYAGQALYRSTREAMRSLYALGGDGSVIGGAAAAGAASAAHPRVVIVGGSFAGLRAQRHLCDLADVTVVDPKTYFEYTPGVLRLYTRPERLGALTTALPNAHSKLVCGSLVAVAPTHIIVRTATGTSQRLEYDYLLLGCGTGYPCAPIKPSAAEVSLAARQATWDKAAAELRAAGSVIVVGGGLVGVELAAEIASAMPGKSVRLLSSGPSLCSSLPAQAGKLSHEWLERHGVVVSLLSPVASVDAVSGTVTLANGALLHADRVYDCRGNGPPTTADVIFADELRDLKDERGRLRVDAWLHCPGSGGRIFAMGDVMAAAPSFASDLKLGHTAELNADVVATNVHALIEHLATPPSAAEAEPLVAEPEDRVARAAGSVSYPQGAVGAPVVPKLCIVSLGEGDAIVVFNDLVLGSSWIGSLLGAIGKPVLEATKVAAAAERPGAVLLWKLGDWGANLISRTLLKRQAPPSLPATPNGRPIILFDGVCLLCSTFIHFVLDHDPEAAFDFAPLQGPTGKKLLKLHGLPLDVSTVVLIDECGHHVRSTAALRVLARCSAPYSYLAAFLWLPRPLRDLGYKMVAAVRYRLFGQDDGSTCRRMTKAMRTRFHE